MMKKIILICSLFFSLSAIGQSYTYIAQRYEWLAGLFKALGLPAGDSAQFQVGQRQRAGSVYYDSTGADAGLYVYDGTDWVLSGSGVPYVNSTGLLANGLLTINGGDPAKFDLAAGSGEILDYATNPINPTKTSVSWSTFTAQTVTNIASADKTYIMINSAGAITQQTTFPTQQERRQKIFVGTIVHPNHSTIQNARTIPDFVQGPASQMYDFFDALGAFSVDGNRISPNGVNLSFNKTAGHIFRRGANYQGDDQNPHVATLAAGTPQSFIKSTVNAQVGGTVTVVDPANYDVGGTVTAIPGGVNNSTIQRVYAFSSGLVFVQYGQTVYSSLAAAISGISNEAFTINPSIADGGVLLGYIVLTKGCTDLSDPAQASILPAPRFDAGIGGGSSAVTNLQQAYNNSVTPQITTTTALGPVDIKRGSAADADNVFRIMNGAGTAVTAARGDGIIYPVANNSVDFGTASLAWKDAYAYTFKLKGATSGEITLAATATAGTNTITFPAVTGTAVLREGIETITGAKTFTSALMGTGGYQTNTAIGTSNWVLVAGGVLTVAFGSTASLQVEGSTGTSTRGAMSGSGSSTLSAGHNYGNFIIGNMPIAEGVSGNHPLLSSLIVRAPSVTGGVATVTNTATVYIDGPISATVSDQNSALWIASGNLRMGKAGTAIGTMSFEGNTSGKVTLTPAAAAGTPTLTFPTTSGTFALTNDLPTLTKSINLPNPGAAENEFIFFTPVAITVTNTRAVLVGSASPSVTYNIGFGTDRTVLTNVYTAGQTVTSTTTGTDASGINDATIPANSWVALTTSAQSGTVTAINLSIQFTED